MKVSEERWKEAQEWERRTWCAQNEDRRNRWSILPRLREFLHIPSSDLGDDWNSWWEEKFGYYRCLPTKIQRAVEFGCGPYTNIRIIMLGRQIDHIYCSDPLVRRYATFRGRWLAEAWRKGRVFLDDHPLEECTFPSGYFDLVVLINVLDHVRDAIMCLKQVVRVTKSGGYLVVGQDLSNSEDAERTKGDIGHPIRIGHDTLDEALTPHFLRVFARVLTREEGRNPSAHYGTYILIGKKVAKSGNLDLSAHDV